MSTATATAGSTPSQPHAAKKVVRRSLWESRNFLLCFVLTIFSVLVLALILMIAHWFHQDLGDVSSSVSTIRLDAAASKKELEGAIYSDGKATRDHIDSGTTVINQHVDDAVAALATSAQLNAINDSLRHIDMLLNKLQNTGGDVANRKDVESVGMVLSYQLTDINKKLMSAAPRVQTEPSPPPMAERSTLITVIDDANSSTVAKNLDYTDQFVPTNRISPTYSAKEVRSGKVKIMWVPGLHATLVYGHWWWKSRPHDVEVPKPSADPNDPHIFSIHGANSVFFWCVDHDFMVFKAR